MSVDPIALVVVCLLSLAHGLMAGPLLFGIRNGVEWMKRDMVVLIIVTITMFVFIWRYIL